MLTSILYAADQAAESSKGLMIVQQLVPFLLIFLIFYFLLIRPQQKKQKKLNNMISTLKAGDKVILTSGIVAKVTTVLSENELKVEIDDDTHMTVLKNAVSSVVQK